jgi:ABC-type nickel/cobalt efflux system permease component RcnA
MLDTKLQKTLTRALARSPGKLGPGDDQQVLNDVRSKLFEESARANRTFNLILGMAVCVFLVMLYLLMQNGDTPGAFAALSVALGTSLTGIIWFALRIVRESSQATLLLALAEGLPAEDALAAFQALLAKQADISVPPAANHKES